MPLALRESTVPASRLEALQSRHARIEEDLRQESLHASRSDLYLRQLKKMKLSVKEQIEAAKSESQDESERQSATG